MAVEKMGEHCPYFGGGFSCWVVGYCWVGYGFGDLSFLVPEARLVPELWILDKLSFNVRLFDEKLRPDPALPCGFHSCVDIHWKSGFFFIDRRAIPDSIIWRHPNAAINDPRPAAGSFSMADVHRLSAHVIKLSDMPKGVLVLFGLIRVWKSRVCDLVLRGVDGNGLGVDFDYILSYLFLLLLAFIVVFPLFCGYRLSFYCTPPAAVDAVIPDPTPKDLAVGTPSFKILAKAEASQKRKASTSGATSSHVVKCTRSSLAQSSSSTTRPSLFVGHSDDEGDGDDDACVEIMLVTPLRFAVVILSLGNHGGSSAAPAAEGSNTQGGVVGNYEFTHEEWDTSYRPNFGVLTKEVFKDPVVCKTVVDQFPTPEGMVRVESLFDDQLTRKMSVLHCMMMSHGSELLAYYRGLNQSHHDVYLEEQVFGHNDKLSSSDASFAKSKAKGNERKKKIKSLTKSLDKLHTKVACLSADLNQATILKAKKDEEILQLRDTPPEFSSFFQGQFQGLVQKFLASDKFSRVLGELLSLVASVGFERGLSMHQTKDKFAAVLKKMANFMLDLTSFVVASEHNDEMVNAEVDVSDPKITADTVVAKAGGASSSPNDVVVAFSAGEKGDGLVPSSVAGVKAVVNPSRV
nr:hypothetical protein [Tanacetum cinerariifolium]